MESVKLPGLRTNICLKVKVTIVMQIPRSDSYPGIPQYLKSFFVHLYCKCDTNALYLHYNIKCNVMDGTLEREQTSFRLSTDLLKRLRIAARRENRSLNNFVESTLMDAVYNIPNEETVAAINEARSGKYAGTIDTSSMEAFIKSCE